jgi:hypothetical protein
MIELQKRVTQKIQRDIAEARQILEDPDEVQALIHLLLDSIDVEQIERTAQQLEASYYEVVAGTSESEKGNERERLLTQRQRDEEHLPGAVEASLKNYPYLSEFGQTTVWYITREAMHALSDCEDSDLLFEVALLVELVVLASAGASRKATLRLRFQPSIMAVGRWAEGRTSLEEVQDLASEFSVYQYKADALESRVASVGTAVTESIDSRERALELGVRYAGERVTTRPSGRVKNRKALIGKNSFVDEVYRTLVAMQAVLEKEGTTPIAVLQGIDVVVNVVNIKRVRSALDNLIAIDVLPGLRMSDDGRIWANQSSTEH